MKRTTTLAPALTISRILTGLWQIADMERDGSTLDPKETARSMLPYVEAGFTTFDMADHYGSAEVITGSFVEQFGEEYPVQRLTKWVPPPGKVTRKEVREAVQRALDRMQAKSLDMLQYHAWSYPNPVWLDTLYWLQELKDEGLIKALGVTNFDAAHLRVALTSGVELVSNQVCYSLIDQRASTQMTDVCEEFGLKLLSFGTLAGGFLSEKWLGRPDPGQQLETWSQMKYKRFIDEAGGWNIFQLVLEQLAGLARDKGTSIAALATRYMLEQPAVGGVIIGARLGKSNHIEDTLKIYDLVLSEEDHDRIEQAISSFRPIPGNCGDEYRKPPFLTASGDLSHHIESIPPAFTPEETGNGTRKIFSGTSWEDMAGYCRAVRKGDRILVSGTTATHENTLVGLNDPEAQATFILDKIRASVESLGGKLEDVVRTRIYVRNINDWEPVARAHGKYFGAIQPANTLVEARLVGDGYLVEMEAEAIVS
jgi:aryl-alcohol dehydrogenase-like predicted oxidoreductase/enamine deaminase RidA (YjgF/YER057c/UK114 family)